MMNCRIPPGEEQGWCFGDRLAAGTEVFSVPCQGCCTQPWDVLSGEVEPLLRAGEWCLGSCWIDVADFPENSLLCLS